MRNLYVVLLIVLAGLLAGCNLALTPATPTLESTIAPDATLPPTRTSEPGNPTLAPPPFATNTVPTVVPLGINSTATLDPALADQRYPLLVQPNNTVGVNYTIVITSGSVTLFLQGTDGLVWQKTFTASETARAEVPVKQGGAYEILAQVENFDGSYSVTWDQKPS